MWSYLSVSRHANGQQSSSSQRDKRDVGAVHSLREQEVLIQPHHHLHAYTQTVVTTLQDGYEPCRGAESAYPLWSLADAEGDLPGGRSRRGVWRDVVHGEARQLAGDFKDVELGAGAAVRRQI